ncbi:hypothetical protein ACFFRR_005659 [Megaselia abdita]
MEQPSEEHFSEENAEKTEKIESIEESASKKNIEDKTESVEQDEVVVEDDNSSEDEQEAEDISEASEKPNEKKEEEPKKPDEIPPAVIEQPEIKEVEIAENNKITENVEIIENKVENDNSNAQLKENSEEVADDSKKVENVIINSNKESVDSDDKSKIIEEVKETTEAPEKEFVKVLPDQVDKVEVIEDTHKWVDSPTTETVSNTSNVGNFEKRIENLNISSVSEKLIQEEKYIQNLKENEKGIVEIRKIERAEEKENKLYAENPSNPTSSYLHKIFTPAEDAPTPKNRQSEYIEEEITQDNKPNNFPLKVVMNPRGKVRDLSSLPNEELFSDTGLLSPDKCKELISALNEPKGKGAELFAKRRKRAEKWAAEDDLQENQRTFYQKPEQQCYQKPQETFYGKQEQIYHQQQQSCYKEPPKPFIQKQPDDCYSKASSNLYQANEQQSYSKAYKANNVYKANEQQNSYQPNKPLNQRELAYKPNVAQGWKSRPINIPTDMYVPKEISLDSYHAPPSADNFIAKPSYTEKVVPVPSTFRNKNPWLQSNGNGNTSAPHNQTYLKVSSEPITSPWHEMERKTPQSNWVKPQPQPSYDYKPQPQYETIQPQYQYQQHSPTPQTQYRSQPPQPIYKPTNDIYNHNFNTAARGWNGSKMGHCYKPITFGQQPKKDNCMQYTDF